MYTPDQIANNPYLLYSFEDIIKAVKQSLPFKQIGCIREDLKVQFLDMTREETMEFNKQVTFLIKKKDRDQEIAKLRNQIQKKQEKIEELLGE